VCEGAGGIRGWSVTGVQTCALPISAADLEPCHPGGGPARAVRGAALRPPPAHPRGPAGLRGPPDGAGGRRVRRPPARRGRRVGRSEEHTSELQSLTNIVCRLLPVKK